MVSKANKDSTDKENEGTLVDPYKPPYSMEIFLLQHIRISHAGFWFSSNHKGGRRNSTSSSHYAPNFDSKSDCPPENSYGVMESRKELGINERQHWER